jgi:hypothetical protein
VTVTELDVVLEDERPTRSRPLDASPEISVKLNVSAVVPEAVTVTELTAAAPYATQSSASCPDVSEVPAAFVQVFRAESVTEETVGVPEVG